MKLKSLRSQIVMVGLSRKSSSSLLHRGYQCLSFNVHIRTSLKCLQQASGQAKKLPEREVKSLVNFGDSAGGKMQIVREVGEGHSIVKDKGPASGRS